MHSNFQSLHIHSLALLCTCVPVSMHVLITFTICRYFGELCDPSPSTRWRYVWWSWKGLSSGPIGEFFVVAVISRLYDFCLHDDGNNCFCSTSGDGGSKGCMEFLCHNKSF